MKKESPGGGQEKKLALRSGPYFAERCCRALDRITGWAIISRDQISGLLGQVPSARGAPGDKVWDDDSGHGRREESVRKTHGRVWSIPI